MCCSVGPWELVTSLEASMLATSQVEDLARSTKTSFLVSKFGAGSCFHTRLLHTGPGCWRGSKTHSEQPELESWAAKPPECHSLWHLLFQEHAVWARYCSVLSALHWQPSKCVLNETTTTTTTSFWRKRKCLSSQNLPFYHAFMHLDGAQSTFTPRSHSATHTRKLLSGQLGPILGFHVLPKDTFTRHSWDSNSPTFDRWSAHSGNWV